MGRIPNLNDRNLPLCGMFYGICYIVFEGIRREEMSDCQFCTVETDCGYPYKPTDCVAQLKFRPKEITVPTDEQVNRDLREQVVKKCWHEWDRRYAYKHCSKCGLTLQKHSDSWNNPDYLNNWNDYGELVHSKCVIESRDFIVSKICEKVTYPEWLDIILDSRRGSMAIWEYFVGAKK
jgi:hypothetical protein